MLDPQKTRFQTTSPTGNLLKTKRRMFGGLRVVVDSAELRVRLYCLVRTRRQDPGFRDPNQTTAPTGGKRHQLPTGHRVVRRTVHGGLHH
jgi:hypothetical protein